MRQVRAVAASSGAPSTSQPLFSRRSFLGTALVPFSLFGYRQPVSAAPEPPSKATPRNYRFELPFEYRPVSSSESSGAHRVQVPVEIRAPAAPAELSTGAPPVVIFSAGFLQSPSSYGTFLSQLLDAGLVVVTYDKSFEELSSLVDDVESAELLARVRTEVAARLGPGAGAGPCFLAGHSRGAKLSVLAAATSPPLSAGPQAKTPTAVFDGLVAGAAVMETRGSVLPPSLQQLHPPPCPVAGLILLDPADGAFEPQDPGRYPSALPPLQNQPSLAGVPVLLVGAARGGDCVPKRKNYAAFFEACRQGPCALVTLQDAGHLQFLDRSDRLAQSICAAGRGLLNTRVAAASGRLAADFVRGVVVAAAAEDAAGRQRDDGGGGPPAPVGTASRSVVLARLCLESLAGGGSGEGGLRYEVQVTGGGGAD